MIEARWFDALVIAILLSPFLVAALHGLVIEWAPASDFAIIEARTADVGTANTPLTGPFSRTGFDHPGPAFFIAAAPLYRLMGSDPRALLVTAAAVNALSVGWVLWMLRRRMPMGAAGIATIIVGVMVLGQSLNDVLFDPWNPSVAIFPFLAFLVALWRVADAEASALVVAVVAGSWSLQNHFGFALPVVVPFVVALALGWRWLWYERRSNGWWFGGAVFAGLVMWTPPLIDQLAGTGNAMAMVTWLRDGGDGEPLLGFGQGARILAFQVIPWGPWSGRIDYGFQFLGITSELWLVAVAAIVIGAIVVGRWRQVPSLGRLAWIVGATLLAGFVSVAQIRGVAAIHLINWARPLGCLVWIVAAWAAVEAIRWADSRSVAIAGLVGSMAVMAPTLAIAADQHPPNDELSPALAEVGSIVRSEVLAPGQPAQVVTSGDSFLAIGAGLLMELERNGVDVVEPEGVDPLIGEHRQGPAAGRTVLVVTYGEKDMAATLADPNLTLVARASGPNPIYNPVAEQGLPESYPEAPIGVFVATG